MAPNFSENCKPYGSLGSPVLQPLTMLNGFFKRFASLVTSDKVDVKVAKIAITYYKQSGNQLGLSLKFLKNNRMIHRYSKRINISMHVLMFNINMKMLLGYYSSFICFRTLNVFCMKGYKCIDTEGLLSLSKAKDHTV